MCTKHYILDLSKRRKYLAQALQKKWQEAKAQEALKAQKEALKEQKEALKAQKEALKEQKEALKEHKVASKAHKEASKANANCKRRRNSEGAFKANKNRKRRRNSEGEVLRLYYSDDPEYLPCSESDSDDDSSDNDSDSRNQQAVDEREVDPEELDDLLEYTCNINSHSIQSDDSYSEGDDDPLIRK